MQPGVIIISQMENLPTKQTEFAWVMLLRTQQVFLNRVEAALKEAELPPLSWYDVLLELSRDAETGLRQFEIGERVLLSKHNLSRLIDRLESEGLVNRHVCDEDGRGNVIKITKQGLQLKAKMWPVYGREIQILIGDKLTTSQVRSLADILSSLLKTNS